MAKWNTIRESFDGNVITASIFPSTFGTISATGGQLVCTIASGGGNYQGVTSVTHDLRDSSFFSCCVDAGNQSLTSLEVYPVQLFLDTNNKIVWLINQNFISARKTVAGSNTQVGSNLAYDSAAHRYFRIRETGGTVYWEYSRDAVAWTVFQTELVSNLFAMSSLYIEIVAGVYASEASGTSATFDSFNISPSNRPSGIGYALGTGSGFGRTDRIR